MLTRCTVMALYSKTGGKNGKHESITDASNIAAISYAAIQVFEHMHGRQFRAIPSATATLQTKQFVILSSYAFICLLSSSPKIRPTGLELGQEDAERFLRNLSGEGKFKEAMRLFRKRKQESCGDEDGTDN